jgi:hypothetical protein
MNNPSDKHESSEGEAEPNVFQVSCILEGIEPPVFRRLQLRDCNLAKLHEILQAAMGWQDKQLHFFEIEGREYTADRRAMAEFAWDNAHKVSLSNLWQKGISEFNYIYDMGNNWVHAIVIEGPEPREPKTYYPRCVEAERTCPVEHCGGPKQYEKWLQAWADKSHPQHKLALQKLGTSFNPEIQSLDLINGKLRRIRN